MTERTDYDSLVEEALQSWPVVENMPDLTPQIMAQVRAREPAAARMWLSWLDVALSLFVAVVLGGVCVALFWLLRQDLTPLLLNLQYDLQLVGAQMGGIGGLSVLLALLAVPLFIVAMLFVAGLVFMNDRFGQLAKTVRLR